MPIKSSRQKAEVRSPKQSREHEDHRRNFMPHSYVSRHLPPSKGLKRKSRRRRQEKNVVTARQQECYCIGVPEALQTPLLLRVGNNDLISQNWYEQWLAFNGDLFNLLMNQFANIHLYMQKIWTLKLNCFQRRPKNRDATAHAEVLSIWSSQESQCPGWSWMQSLASGHH